MMRRAMSVLGLLLAFAVPAAANSLDGAVATGYAPRVPVSAFARPLAWFDSSRLHMTHSIAVGSGFSGGTSALQTTEFSYAFRAPVTLKVAVGNTLGTSGFGGSSNGANFFLQGLDLGYQPSANTTLRVVFQNVRSPLQYGAGNPSPYGRSFWGY
ncbi:MAG: hypothetical protein HZA61_15225 [Candidatus Eisenbacteria bacterium]|uniref:Uncharacterized protein n=1 Tax=Eiseniibacteriota bacterium TaxID=2212470 RepID=A0A933SEB8_UNCEI|nr:hypothetical protein [Candidatus Eisenbacteria bacterium]